MAVAERPLERKAGTVPEIFYESTGPSYWLAHAGRYMRLGEGAIKMHLRRSELNGGQVAVGVNEVEAVLCKVQLERYLEYAGPVAGYKPGLHHTPDGRAFLVTGQPSPEVFDTPKGPDRFRDLENLIEQWLGPKQMHYLLAWMKYAAESLRRLDFRPGQLLCLAGESSCGKSFLQELITAFLGGRQSNPFKYLVGKTDFNQDLAESEHWAMTEITGSTDPRARRRFGDAIKSACVGRNLWIQPKGKKAFTIPTWRRVSLSINDSTETLLALPPIDEEFLNKIILLKCSKPDCLSESLEENWKRFASQLPALRVWLHRWKVPKFMHDSRFGVCQFQHPDLFAVLQDIDPEMRLLDILDHCLEVWPWKGQAIELENLLCAHPTYGRQASRLLGDWHAATGSYLGKLAVRFPQRIEARRSEGKTRWTIRAPIAKEGK